MIKELVPPAVTTAEAFADLSAAPLSPSEERVIAGAAESRRRAFTTGRTCARRALSDLGATPGPILPGRHGAPIWPADVVGSITHCEGYRAAAVAWRNEIVGVGIDAEPNRHLPDIVLRRIALPSEQRQLQRLAVLHPAVAWDRLLFSAKEAAYKLWYPLTRGSRQFADTAIGFDASSGTFSAQSGTPIETQTGEAAAELSGKWLMHDGLLITAVVLLGATICV